MIFVQLNCIFILVQFNCTKKIMIIRNCWDKMGNMEFSRKVKELREKKGLTMEKLANELGVSKSRVNMWENNGTVPRQDVLIQLAKYFGVSSDVLLGIEYFSNTSSISDSIQRKMKDLDSEETKKVDAYIDEILSKRAKDIFEGKI